MPPDVDITLIIIIAIVLGIPILGLTARLAIQPIVQALIQLQEAFGRAETSHLLSPRLNDLEEEVDRLSASVNHLLEAQEFREALEAPQEGAPGEGEGGR